MQRRESHLHFLWYAHAYAYTHTNCCMWLLWEPSWVELQCGDRDVAQKWNSKWKTTQPYIQTQTTGGLTSIFKSVTSPDGVLCINMSTDQGEDTPERSMWNNIQILLQLMLVMNNKCKQLTPLAIHNKASTISSDLCYVKKINRFIGYCRSG